MKIEPMIYDRKQAGELVSTFLGMVLAMCKSLGMDEEDAISLFSKERIRGGYKILAKRAEKD